ncbi:hypothetical protein [Psychrobacter glacincola]|uniref:hypothetical protein n=1 Tax=Psychrobacter glacincola TaxID=56810 RepID=UPI0039AFCFF5
MALISCPECTHAISDQSVSCTNCGLPTSKMRFTIKCPECSEFTTNQSISCANCGFPIAKPAPFKSTQPSPEELKEIKLLKKLEEIGEHEESGGIEMIGVIIIICIGIYFMSKNDDINYLLQHVVGLFSR